MKIPFDIKFRPQIESGEYKVEIRDGKPARVLCWDRAAKEDQPKDLKLCVLVQENGGESVYYYYSDGTKWVANDDYDLFLITPEPELTEFENAIVKIVKLCDGTCSSESDIKECIKSHSEELLELARKELEKEEPSIIEARSYISGLKQGKSEALKDLPRWGSNIKSSMVDKADVIGQWLYYKEHRIRISDLEKLPGFNE